MLDAQAISVVIAGLLVGLAFMIRFVTPCIEEPLETHDDGRSKAG